jgi:hypothetical protein
MNDDLIKLAIRQAKLEGNKGVIGFTGDFENHRKYSNLLNEGRLETFNQVYYHNDMKLSCLLMRKPKK